MSIPSIRTAVYLLLNERTTERLCECLGGVVAGWEECLHRSPTRRVFFFFRELVHGEDTPLGEGGEVHAPPPHLEGDEGGRERKRRGRMGGDGEGIMY